MILKGFILVKIKGGVLGYFKLFRLLNLMSARHKVGHRHGNANAGSEPAEDRRPHGARLGMRTPS